MIDPNVFSSDSDLFKFCALHYMFGFKRVDSIDNDNEKQYCVLTVPEDDRKSLKDINKDLNKAKFTVRVGHGVGIGSLYCEYYFNSDGKFITHGCWE